MLRIDDIDDSLDFYVSKLGMKVLSCNRRPNGAATAFVAFGDKATKRDLSRFALELAAAPKRKDSATGSVEVGSFGGLWIAGDQKEIEMKDPSGYPLRRVSKQQEQSIVALCLETADLRSSISFYTEKLGMSVAEDSPKESADAAYLQYSSGPQTYLCLQQADKPVNVGSGFDHLVVSTNDVQEAADQLQDLGVKLTMKPTVMFGLKIMGIQDVDGYKIFLVDEADFAKSNG